MTNGEHMYVHTYMHMYLRTGQTLYPLATSWFEGIINFEPLSVIMQNMNHIHHLGWKI